jgi:hypothetical protein
MLIIILIYNPNFHAISSFKLFSRVFLLILIYNSIFSSIPWYLFLSKMLIFSVVDEFNFICLNRRKMFKKLLLPSQISVLSQKTTNSEYSKRKKEIFFHLQQVWFFFVVHF